MKKTFLILVFISFVMMSIMSCSSSRRSRSGCPM